MLDYARQRAIAVLCLPRRAVLATDGPAGLLLGEFPCEADGLVVYLLLPRTSDHLLNLEEDPSAAVLTVAWEASGRARLQTDKISHPRQPAWVWEVWVRFDPVRIQVRGEEGWGIVETIDLAP